MTEDPNVFGAKMSVKQPPKGRVSCKPSISLLSLPYELHRQIITDLTDHQAAYFCPRRINTYFWSLISPDDIRKYYPKDTPKMAQAALQEIERLFTYLIVDSHFPCKLCLCILPADRFNKWQRSRGLGGVNGQCRFCKSCGRLRVKLYVPDLKLCAPNAVDFLMSRREGRLVLRPGWKWSGHSIQAAEPTCLSSKPDMRHK